MHYLLIVYLSIGLSIAQFKESKHYQRGFQQSEINEEFLLLKIKVDQNAVSINDSQFEKYRVQLLQPLTDSWYFALIPNSLTENQIKALGIKKFEIISHREKMDPLITNHRIPKYAIKGQSVELVIEYFHIFSKNEILDDLKNYSAVVLDFYMQNKNFPKVLIPMSKLNDLSASPRISKINLIHEEPKKLNIESRQLHRIPFVQPDFIHHIGLYGDNVTIGIGDGGELGNHIDFGNRVVHSAVGSYSSFGDHGDHVTGIAAGAGWLNPRHRGIASKANLVIEKTSLISYYAQDYYSNYDMVLTNNSYGTSFNCANNGTYNYTSKNLDKQILEMPSLMHVFAAGNSGNQTCIPYPTGFKTVLRYYQSAKNVLTVGNITDLSVIKNNSSRGPLADGRLKPEVVSNGTSIISTSRDFDYTTKSGTSMASPAVVGTLGLMYEKYKDKNGGEQPKSSLMKAIIMNTARDLGNPGPDYIYGYGLINARRAIQNIEDENYLLGQIIEEGEIKNHNNISIPSNTKKVKIMLYWNDQIKEISNDPGEPTLTNNLDLKVIGPNGEIHLPLVLNPSPANVDDMASPGIDHLNNSEQISLDLTNMESTSNDLNIQVIGSKIQTQMGQEYVITYEFIKDDITVTYPNGKEKIIPEDYRMITWDALNLSNSTFKIEYSENNGLSWNTIASGISANQREYFWNTNLNRSFKSKIKVSSESLDNAISDTSNYRFTVLERPENLDFNIRCGLANRVKLTWNHVLWDNNLGKGKILYDVFKYNDQEMEKVATVKKNYFNTSYLQTGKTYWYTVRTRAKKGFLAGFGKNYFSERQIAIPVVHPGGIIPCEEDPSGEEPTRPPKWIKKLRRVK
jgi:hypothetical protein